MQAAADPVAEGGANAREVLDLARARFRGACLMPPFDHFEIIPSILAETK
jgi:homocysteine S-methyltransferase